MPLESIASDGSGESEDKEVNKENEDSADELIDALIHDSDI